MSGPLTYIFIFIFGTIIGSFLNCVIYRLETGKGFIKGHSFCPACKHELAWSDLIPILSFFLLSKKCRYCKKPISWQYPVIEIATGIMFVITTHNLQPTTYSPQFLLNLFYWLFVVSCLLVIFVYDLKHFIIPDKVLFPAIAISIIFNFQFSIFQSSILSAFAASGFFLAIFLVSKGLWIGFGDVKLAILLGLFLGWPKIILALFLSFFIGGIIGVGLVFNKKRGIKSEIPFAPFLITGTFISLFFGERIISWYLSFFI